MKHEVLKSELYKSVRNAFVNEHKNVRVFDKSGWHINFDHRYYNIRDIRNIFKEQYELGGNFVLVRFETF